MRRLAATGLVGWAGIMALGWFLADRRAARCSDTYNCTVHELGTRDAFLVTGLLGPLLLVAALYLVSARRRARPAGQMVQAEVLPSASHQHRQWMGLGPSPGRLPPRPRLASLAWIIAAFCMGWAGAYATLIWLPARIAAPMEAISDEARDAAAEAVEAAADAEAAAQAAQQGYNLSPVDGDPIAAPEAPYAGSELTPVDGDPFEPSPVPAASE